MRRKSQEDYCGAARGCRGPGDGACLKGGAEQRGDVEGNRIDDIRKGSTRGEGSWSDGVDELGEGYKGKHGAGKGEEIAVG
jgi:hypothetical protein